MTRYRAQDDGLGCRHPIPRLIAAARGAGNTKGHLQWPRQNALGMKRARFSRARLGSLAWSPIVLTMATRPSDDHRDFRPSAQEGDQGETGSSFSMKSRPRSAPSVRQVPKHHTVFFNGSKPEKAFRRHVLPALLQDRYVFARLPSTSPAHAAMRFEAKVQAWSVVKNHTIWQPAPPPRCMHRRIEIDWALERKTPKAVADAPLGARARQ
jgi:hypothetical protein